MSESGFPYQDMTPPATHLGLTYPRPRLPHQNTYRDHFIFGKPNVHSTSRPTTMASPSASLISALDKIPTVSPTNASSPKLDPLILSEIKEPGTGLGVISREMFDASRWYSSLFPSAFPSLYSCFSHTVDTRGETKEYLLTTWPEYQGPQQHPTMTSSTLNLSPRSPTASAPARVMRRRSRSSWNCW